MTTLHWVGTVPVPTYCGPLGYGSSVRYHHEHGKYATKYHVDTGPLRAIYMYSGLFGYGRGKGSTRAQFDGHQSSKLPIQFEQVYANLVRKPGARIWPKVWVFSSVASLVRWLRAIR